ncbi:ABC transporter substrate-binding protein [Desulfoluna sp.]|uniref:ABC transporter substrate-binding protein n=1 Tax=Desulfoluna sp. TaxID=2045199 RepID=UPI002634B306|nr:ABC transporter substrate-binding protein [Desulfoluna sp.]
MKRLTRILLITAALFSGHYLLFPITPPVQAAPASGLHLGNNPDLPTLTFYTSGLATTPQLPLWYAARKGNLLSHCNLEVKVWKTIDDLRGNVLAGKGDLWLGQTHGFVQAARRGAPVKLLAVTAWRKFYLVSTDETRLHFADYQGETLSYAPTGSPAVPILQSILKSDRPIRFKPGQGRQLAMLLMKGKITAALVPEPMVSILTMKVPGLKVGENVETLYGNVRQSKPRMPIAGLAIHTKLLTQHPGLAEAILDELKKAGEALAQHPEDGAAVLPEAFTRFVTPELVTASLKRDAILVERAREVQSELKAYLDVILPDHAPSEADLEATLF